MNDKLWCVQHKPSGMLLHIRVVDDDGSPLKTHPELQDWWIAHSRQQAEAQASFLGDDWAPAYLNRTGKAAN